MKRIANRQGDAQDCSNLVIAGLDYNTVYREIELQYRKAGEAKEKIWINYIEDGIARLQDNDLTVPIGDKISLLASEYHEKL
jgi:ligand-binding sensor domain-containing protein